MKTLREIRESVASSTSDEAEYIEESNISSISNIPFVIVLKRKAIRIYPNGQKVALYHNEKLDKFVTIPFSDIGVSEETNLQEVSKNLLKRYTTKAKEKADSLEKTRDNHGSLARQSASSKDSKAAQAYVDRYNDTDSKLKKKLRGISLADRKSDPNKYEKYPKQFKAKVHATENFDALSNIQGKTRLTFSDEKTMSINEDTAKAILALHNRLTEENQEKLVSMVNGTKEQFQTIAEFATQGQ